MTRGNHGAPTMARGVRVAINDTRLDALLCGVQVHADMTLSAEDSKKSFEEIAKLCDQRDRVLRELAEQTRLEAYGAGASSRYLADLLVAVQRHSEWRFQAHVWAGLDDYFRQQRENDQVLYDAAAAARVEACRRSEDPMLYLDPEVLREVLAGERTVMRIPAEHNRTGKMLHPHYREDGGKGGFYRLATSQGTLDPTAIRPVPTHTVRMVSVRSEPLGEVDDAEARREGSPDRATFLQGFWGRHGHALFDWTVWRYELEPIKR